MRTPTLSLSFLAALAVSAASLGARAETKLSTQVIVGSQPGFLVTSTIVSGEKEAILVDGAFTLADAHRVVAAILVPLDCDDPHRAPGDSVRSGAFNHLRLCR